MSFSGDKIKKNTKINNNIRLDLILIPTSAWFQISARFLENFDNSDEDSSARLVNGDVLPQVTHGYRGRRILQAIAVDGRGGDTTVTWEPDDYSLLANRLT